MRTHQKSPYTPIKEVTRRLVAQLQRKSGVRLFLYATGIGYRLWNGTEPHLATLCCELLPAPLQPGATKIFLAATHPSVRAADDVREDVTALLSSFHAAVDVGRRTLRRQLPNLGAAA